MYQNALLLTIVFLRADTPNTDYVICYLYQSDALCTCSFWTPEFKKQLELEILWMMTDQ